MKPDLYADMHMPSLLSRAAKVPSPGVPPTPAIWEAFKDDVDLMNDLEGNPGLVFLDHVAIWSLTIRWGCYLKWADPTYAEVTEGMVDDGADRAIAERLRSELGIRITWKEGSLQ
jgi:hypothetical protein